MSQSTCDVCDENALAVAPKSNSMSSSLVWSGWASPKKKPDSVIFSQHQSDAIPDGDTGGMFWCTRVYPGGLYWYKSCACPASIDIGTGLINFSFPARGTFIYIFIPRAKETQPTERTVPFRSMGQPSTQVSFPALDSFAGRENARPACCLYVWA